MSLKDLTAQEVLDEKRRIAQEQAGTMFTNILARTPPGSSRLTKAAFILPGPQPQIIEFQLNPELLKRDIELSESSGGGNKSGQEKEGMGSDLRTSQSLGQKISIEFMLDGKEYPDEEGILPILSAIENLMEPEKILESVTAADHKNPPFSLRQVMFRWGNSYIVPVKIESLSVEETDFSPTLIPIRAKVSMEMKMLIPSTTQGVSFLMIEAYNHLINQRKTRSDNYFTNKKAGKDVVIAGYRDTSQRA